jgi:cell division protein FtsA
MKNDTIFALDIGTRTVVGLLCRIEAADRLQVTGWHVEAHPQRSMLDGHIHDVPQVSAVIRRVKEKLEAQAGFNLERAAIAAAGRALLALRAQAVLTLPSPTEITGLEIRQLEVAALNNAREQMAESREDLFCVGYSPISYTLDSFMISNPEGQKGRVLETEIIATFLPRVVVDSLFSALARAGLGVSSLTLEPIAAMAVAIPPRLRMLNLALIDIGAGTSDIAISRGGTVLTYAMVDKAGDEVTEALAQHYLLDFNAAENMKISLAGNEFVEFVDVLGNRYRERVSDIYQQIEPVVDDMAANLARVIKEQNGGTSPSAVFCVGGGSQTPLLKEYLSLHLELPPERIGIRTREQLEGIEFESMDLMGPEIVTPLGIALTALHPQGDHFIQVRVNGSELTLVNVQQCSVAQALLHSGIDVNSLLSRKGKSLEFILNGEPQRIAGRPGVPGVVTVNSNPATLETAIQAGDHIEVAPGIPGQAASILVGEVDFALPQALITVDGMQLNLPRLRLINGLPAMPEAVIHQGDRLDIRYPQTIAELASLMDLDLASVRVSKNGQGAALETSLQPGDQLELQAISFSHEVAPSAASQGIQVFVNSQQISLSPGQQQLMHALTKAEIDYSIGQGRLVIHVNGREADFSTHLEPGDRIEAFWTGG